MCKINKIFACFGALLALFVAGCATPVISPDSKNTSIIVPGLGGDGDAYADVAHGLEQTANPVCIRVFDWGDGWPLFPLTIYSSSLHDSAERDLADLINQWQKDHPGAHISLIAHSAGAGVVLGALSRLNGGTLIGPVILLAPDVSPDYRLSSALRHVNVIHVFYSEDDLFWQGIGAFIFGTYDGNHSDGAGRVGFSLADLSDSEKKKVFQHPYRLEWDQYDNGGGHFDWLSEQFASHVLRPLIDQSTVAASVPPKPADTVQSIVASHP